MSIIDITFTMKKQVRKWFRLLEQRLNSYRAAGKQEEVKVRVLAQDEFRGKLPNQIRKTYSGERL